MATLRFLGNLIWFFPVGVMLASSALALYLFIFVWGSLYIKLTGEADETNMLIRASWGLVRLTAFPFGVDIVHGNVLEGKTSTEAKIISGGIDVVWIVLIGAAGALLFGLLAVGLCISIIGIPWGFQAFKIARFVLAPIGRVIVPVEVAKAAKEKHAQKQLAEFQKK